MACPSPCVPVRKASPPRMWSTATTASSKTPSSSSASPSTSTHAPHRRPTTSLPPTSSASSTMTASSSRRPPSNITTRRCTTSSPTATLRVSAPIAAIWPMATSARTAVAATCRPRSLSIPAVAGATPPRCFATPRTGICPSTNTRNGSGNGFSRSTRSGDPMYMDSARAGLRWT